MSHIANLVFCFGFLTAAITVGPICFYFGKRKGKKGN